MRRNSSPAVKRFAFTLVETLLALVLSSTLLLAIFSLIDSTLNYHVTGTDQVLVSQRMIGLLHDLRSDVQAVQADPHWQAVPQAQVPIEERFEETKAPFTRHMQLTEMQKRAEPIHLAGQTDWLVLTLGHANPRWLGDADRDQQIVWSLGGRGSINVPTHDDHGRWTTHVIPGTDQAGLVRSRILATGKQSQSVQSDLVIEAADLSFRFLSGGHWRSSWNSSTEKRLPDAIEINLRIKNDALRRSWVIQTSAQTSALRSQAGTDK